MIRDAIILGAGAAGLMCAMTAGRRGFSCAVIDHSPVAGRKVRLAGGGKGNVTNRYISPEWYVGTQKGFPDTLLKRCSTDFVLSMLASFGIEWEEREYEMCIRDSPRRRGRHRRSGSEHLLPQREERGCAVRTGSGPRRRSDPSGQETRGEPARRCV